MNDSQLRDALAALGLTEAHTRVLALLPLVEVAWADGHVHPREQKQVMALSARLQLSSSEDELLASWLSERPSGFYLDRGRALLRELVRRRSAGLEPVGIVSWCWAIAESAGGIFGFGAVAPEEREAITAIANALNVAPDVDWRAHVAEP